MVSMVGSAVGAVGSTVYYGLDALAKVSKDVDGTNQLVKISSVALKFATLNNQGETVLPKLMSSLSVVEGFCAARSWMGKAYSLVSGEAAGLRSDGTWNNGLLADNSPRILADGRQAPSSVLWLDEQEGVWVPNFLKMTSIASLLVADLMTACKWVDTVAPGYIDFAAIVSSVGDLPVFGSVLITLTFEGVKNTFCMVGFIVDFADGLRDITQNGLTMYNIAQLVGDAAKITGIAIAMAGGGFVVIALIANGTSSLCFIARFVMKTYDVGMRPVFAQAPHSVIILNTSAP